MLKELKETVTRNNLERRVFIIGNRAHEDVFRLFAGIDIFLHSQRHSNYGWALLETMASGKPVIVTDTLETHDIIKDGVNGLIVPHNAESMAKAMETLAENEALRWKLGIEAQKTIRERHSLKNLELYEQALLEVIRRNAS